MRGAATLSKALAASAASFAAALVAVLVSGCATTTVDIAFDDRQDFSGYRTWGWLSRAAKVEAAPSEEPALDALTSRLVDRELRGRGLVLAHDGADLLVSYALRIQRQVVAVNETSAENLLPSLHASPSYLIQVTTTRVEVYDSGHLQIVVTDGRSGRVVWRGDLWARHRENFARHLPDHVSRLLGQFPEATPASEPSSPPLPSKPERRNGPSHERV
jgi:hypothetical protein